MASPGTKEVIAADEMGWADAADVSSSRTGVLPVGRERALDRLIAEGLVIRTSSWWPAMGCSSMQRRPKG